MASQFEKQFVFNRFPPLLLNLYYCFRLLLDWRSWQELFAHFGVWPPLLGKFRSCDLPVCDLRRSRMAAGNCVSSLVLSKTQNHEISTFLLSRTHPIYFIIFFLAAQTFQIPKLNQVLHNAFSSYPLYHHHF